MKRKECDVSLGEFLLFFQNLEYILKMVKILKHHNTYRTHDLSAISLPQHGVHLWYHWIPLVDNINDCHGQFIAAALRTHRLDNPFAMADLNITERKLGVISLMQIDSDFIVFEVRESYYVNNDFLAIITRQQEICTSYNVPVRDSYDFVGSHQWFITNFMSCDVHFMKQEKIWKQ